MPKLSIITVNLNNAAGLRKTIASVRAQTFRDYEHIIIDGGSTDGSVDVIKEFADGFSYWVSEPDGGIYQGMNKGTRIAKGEYCLYLNSGDYLYNGKVLEKVFKERFSEDIVYGDLIIEEKTKKRYLAKGYTGLSSFDFPHPAAFIKRTLLKKLKGYNEQFKIAGDTHFFRRATFIYGASYRHIPVKITVFNRCGISCNPKYAKLLRQELSKIQKEIFPNIQIRLEMQKFMFLVKGAGKTKFRKNLSLQNEIKDRDVYVWGTGSDALKVLDFLIKKHIRIEAFLDSNKEIQGLAFAGYRIYEPSQILTQGKNIFVVIASEVYSNEMAEICENYGLKKDRDFCVPFSAASKNPPLP